MIQLRKCHGGRLENTAFTLAVQFGGRNSVYRYFMSPVPRLPRVFIAAYITRPELRGSQEFPSRDRSEFVSFAGDSFTARNCCNVTTKIGQFRLYCRSFLLHFVYVQSFYDASSLSFYDAPVFQCFPRTIEYRNQQTTNRTRGKYCWPLDWNRRTYLGKRYRCNLLGRVDVQ